jgi:hypothetical protein
MEIRDAATGTIINSLAPSTYNSSYGTLLVPQNGIVSYVGNDSWLLTPTQSGPALGNDNPFDLQNGSFGILGNRVVEAGFGGVLYVFGQNGIDFTPFSMRPAHAAAFSGTINPYRVYLQDLDHDGVDEVIRTQWDWDGYVALVENIEGFGYEQTSLPDGLDILEIQPVPVQLTGAVSRKVHGSAGPFDVDLPFTGNPGIECRSGGANGDYTLVFSFASSVTSVGGANVTGGNGTIISGNIDPTDAHSYIVNLTGVTNAQFITVSLTNVTDSAGNFSPAVAGQMGVLIGDVNASGRVDAADVSLVRQQTLQPISSSNFREDVNASGRIDAADVSIVRQQTLTSLP